MSSLTRKLGSTRALLNARSRRFSSRKLSVSYSEPFLGDEEANAVAAVVRSGRLVMGPRVGEFEHMLATFSGRRHAIMVTSGTSALQMALALRGVAGPAWTVFVPAYTWVATYNVPFLAGCRVVLVDVRCDTYSMSMRDLRRSLHLERTQRPSQRLAVMPVHMFGYRCGFELDEIKEGVSLDDLEREFPLTVIGDAGCGFASVEGGRRCGSWTPVECTSFHPRKIITTGEGGVVFTDNDADADFCRRFRDHGAVRSATQRAQTTAGGPETPLFPTVGTNLRPTEMQGALGVQQMHRIEEIVRRRVVAAEWYDARIAASPILSSVALVPVAREEPARSSSGLDDCSGSVSKALPTQRVLTAYPLLLHARAWGPRRPENASTAASRLQPHVLRVRDAAMRTLSDKGIAVRPPMIALSEAEHVRDACVREREGRWCFESDVARQLTLGLPLHAHVTRDMQETVVAALEDFFVSETFE
jgi:perosamine synthetase